MASTTPISLSSSSSTALVESKAARRQPTNASAQCMTLPTLASPLHHQTQNRATKTANAYSKKMARNVAAMATGSGTQSEFSTAELPDYVKTIQEAWEKVEDKYAVSSLAVTAIIALWGSTGMLSAIDRLPLIPGVLELVGIGYTGWFAYKNLVFKPDREALLRKIKCTYEEIIGTS